MDTTSAEAVPPSSATAIVANNSNSNNSSIGNSSSNSSSSGYGSATTTPTTPLGSMQYESNTPTPNVPTVAAAVESIPVATVAAVTPFYNEAITAAQTYHRQQYYQQSYVYPGVAGTVGGAGVQTQPLQQYNVYDGYMGSNNNQHAPNVERTTTMRYAHTSHAAPVEKLTAKLSPNLQHAATVASSSASSNNIVYKHETSSSGTTATSKPQAAATAFYAQPLHAANSATAGSGGYFDSYKYKMPTKLPNPTPDYSSYGNHHPLPTNAVAASYQQQQYYAAAKSQLQEATYAASAVKPMNAANTRPPNVSAFYGSSNSAYYDKYEKYMYTPTASTLPHATQSVNAAGATYPSSHPSHPPPPHHFSSTHETPTDSYRKTATAWHWNMEYSAGNCRSLPPAGVGIPTATVSPTNATYYPQATATSRDAYYAHEKYAKYDKYGPYYHQQYIPTPPPQTTRSVWPSSHMPHLAPQITERLQHTHPPSLQHSHSAQHYAPTTASATANVRQNCCSQPPYQQQSCYYPRAPPHHVSANAYPAPPHPQQSHFATGVSGNSKYGNLPDYSYSNKLKNSNDLYVSSPFDTTLPAHLNYNYAQSTSQRYPVPGVIQHQSVSPAALHGGDQNTAYYNDLNLHPTYDNYTASIQQQQHHQHHVVATRTQHHLPPPYLPPNHGKPSLLDYRKPTTTQNTDCYMSQSAIANLEDHVAGNASYPSYDLSGGVNTSTAIYSNDASVDSNSDKSATTKNLSLRDFLSTWNEDEEEYGASEQLNFVESDASHSKHAANIMPTEISHKEDASQSPYLHDNEDTQPLSYKITSAQPTQKAVPEIIEKHLQFKGSFNTRPKIHVGITVDSTVDVEANQYINLPDIIIDIEKSNNIGPTLSANVSDTKAVALGNFDVEKELDELQLKKTNICTDKQLEEDRKPVEDSKIILHKEDVNNDFNIKEHLQQNDTKHDFEMHQIKQGNADDIVEDNKLKNLEPGGSGSDFDEKSKNGEDLPINALSPVQTAPDSSFDNPEQFLKDIEYDNNSHSNESTFEKEYETFINKIGSDTEVEMTTRSKTKNNIVSAEVTDLSFKKEVMSDKEIESEVSEDNKSSSQDDHDFAQNVKEFSKFYKRKRKLFENNMQEGPTSPKHASTATTSLIQEKTKNFPRVYTKISRKRKQNSKQKSLKADINCKDVKTIKGIKGRKYWKPLSQYYKILHSIRRFRYGKIKVDTSALVEQHVAMLKERHLPLIKRQSAKQYLPKKCVNFSPRTLKCLSVSIVNTEQFRQSILRDADSTAYKKVENIDLTTESVIDQKRGKHLTNNNINAYVKKFAEDPKKIVIQLGKIEPVQSVSNLKEEAILTNDDVFMSESSIQQNEKNSGSIKLISTESDIKKISESSDVNDQKNVESNIFDPINENTNKAGKEMLDIGENGDNSEVTEYPNYVSESINKNGDNSKVTEHANYVSESINKNIIETDKQKMDLEVNIHNLEVEKKLTNISELINTNIFEDGKQIMDTEETKHFVEVTENETKLIEAKPISPEKFESNIEKTNPESPFTEKIYVNIFEDGKQIMDIEETKHFVEVTENETKLIEAKPISPENFESNIEKTNPESPFTEKIYVDIFEDGKQIMDIEKTKYFVEVTEHETKLIEAKPISPENFESNIEKTNLESPFKEKINVNSPINFIEIDESSSSSSGSDSSTESNSSESTSSSEGETASSSTSEASDFNEFEALEKELSQQRPLKGFSETSDSIGNKTDDKFAHESSEYDKTKNTDSVKTSDEITNNDIAHVKKMLESDHEELDAENNTTSEKYLENTEIIDENISSNLDNFTKVIHNTTDATNIAEKSNVAEDLSLLASQEMTDEANDDHNLQIMFDDSEPVKINETNFDLPSLKCIVKAFLNSNDIALNNTDTEFDQDVTEQHVGTTMIPKLSDLCKIALNSSFECSELTMNINDSTTQQQHQVPVECRELSVEEALAEMYRQAGVASDPEDYEMDEKEAQDVLLINLEEILDSDSDLYVLQCDMNENILGVVAHSDAETESENTERVNTLQLVEILNSSDFDRNENELQLFNANDNFIVFSNTTDDNADESQSSETPSQIPVNDIQPAAIIEENNDSLTSQFDLPTIHHEEIVPDNYKTFEKEQFLKYLHEKYVQKNISKFYHANRILKKYKRRITNIFLKSMKTESI